MLTHEERVLCNLLEDRIVATERWYAVKFKLRRDRADRIKRTKKQEPHVGNKAPILRAHAEEESRCIDRLCDALGVGRRDMRALEEKASGPWVAQARVGANRRLKADRELGCRCVACPGK